MRCTTHQAGALEWRTSFEPHPGQSAVSVASMRMSRRLTGNRVRSMIAIVRNRMASSYVRNIDMMRLGRIVRTMLLAGVVVSAPAFARDADKPRIRLGGISAGVGYVSGPGWYGPYSYGPGLYRPWWGLYDPFWYSPFLHSGLYTGFAQGPNMGQIKLEASKDASVYLDGAFAGSAAKLKSMWLEPGIYELQVQAPGGEEYKRKLYVLSGKTLHIKTGAKP